MKKICIFLMMLNLDFGLAMADKLKESVMENMMKEEEIMNSSNDINIQSIGVTEEKEEEYREAKKEKPVSNRKSELIKIENEGRLKREEHTEMQDLLINKGSPEAQKYKNRFKKELPKVSKDLISELKDRGIFCVEEGGSKGIKSPYVLGFEEHVEQEDAGDHDYEPRYCEHLQNKYKCTDSIDLRCAQFSEDPASFKVSNFSYSGSDYGWHEMDDPMTYTSLERFHRYYSPSSGGSVSGSMEADDSNVSLKAKVDHRKYGEYSTSTLRYIDWGAFDASEVKLSFNLIVDTDLKVINNISLSGSYTHTIMIKVNGSVVYMAPDRGSDLKITNRWRQQEFRDSSFWTSSKHQLFRIINVGGREHVVQKLERIESFNNVNLKKFLRAGKNVIEIKSIASMGAWIDCNMKITERKCLRWQEEWRESCSLEKK